MFIEHEDDYYPGDNYTPKMFQIRVDDALTVQAAALLCEYFESIYGFVFMDNIDNFQVQSNDLWFFYTQRKVSSDTQKNKKYYSFLMLEKGPWPKTKYQEIINDLDLDWVL